MDQTAEQVVPDDASVALVEVRIDNLRNVADRFDRPGGSPRLARRARDKADGMETALRLLGVCERGVFGDSLIHHLLTTPPAVSSGVYAPKGGDGSVVLIRVHNELPHVRCPGSKKEPADV